MEDCDVMTSRLALSERDSLFTVLLISPAPGAAITEDEAVVEEVLCLADCDDTADVDCLVHRLSG